VVGHASLPGIALAFLVMELIRPGMGRSIPGLLCGAFAGGLLGALCTLAITHLTRLRDDAALAIVLSLFFGLGVALFTVVQKVGRAAGLHQFVFGKTSLIVADDVKLFAALAVAVTLAAMLLFKELTILCFDQEFAATQGWPVFWLDALLMGLIVAVSVIGLQTVGLLLVVALPIIPASAARFWTDDLKRMAMLAAVIGGGSAVGGVVVSAMFPRMPTGPLIVLVGAGCFTVSLFAGTRRGVLPRLWRNRRLARQHDRLDLMRACYEYLEQNLPEGMLFRSDMLGRRMLTEPALLPHRSWSPARLHKLLSRGVRDRLLLREGESGYRLTPEGVREAVRAARNHRLWELYLIRHADIAPSHVDHATDRIEHILGPEVTQELEAVLGMKYPHLRVPESPHRIDPSPGSGPFPEDASDHRPEA
jgi:manganese/zinc/iron transport system permease protein